MTTARNTLSSVWSLVGTTAATATGLVDSINTLGTVAQAQASSFAKRHALRLAVDDGLFEKRLIAEKTLELAQLNESATKFKDKSTDHANWYDTSFDQISKLVEEHKA